ncbi:MAG: PilZ domain-containing protein [Syntrophales bacterium]
MEKSKIPREKRKSERVFMYLPLEYRVRNAPYIHEGYVVNASEGGFLIHSNKDMPVGMKLRLELLFPKGFELNNFEAEAEIVWKEDGPEDESEKYQYGIRFTQMSEDDQRKLKQLLSGRLQRKAQKDLSSGFVNFELRRHPRHAVDLPVECCKTNSPISHTGRAINASEGGLMVYLPEKVEIGQHLKLMLSVGSESALDTVDMIAQVVWVDIGYSMPKEEYRAGVMIVDISSTDRLKLKDLLESLSQ